MSDLPPRVDRAFRDHDAFERIESGVYASTTTSFEATVEVHDRETGDLEFHVTVRVPMLSAVTEADVASVVEDGWYETFELRVRDPSGVFRADRSLDPEVTTVDDEIVINATIVDADERRGVDDVGAFIDFVEGTFVQGIIPGYEYTEPVTYILSDARARAGAGRPDDATDPRDV